MKTFIFSLLFFCCFSISHADEFSGNINIIYGFKVMNKLDFEPVDVQSEIGVEFDFGNKNWPACIAIDILRSSDTDIFHCPDFGAVDVEGLTSEIHIGLRKIFPSKPGFPVFQVLEGGFSFITCELKAELFNLPLTFDESGTGFWLGGGLYLKVFEPFHIGIKFKYSSAQIVFLDEEYNAGGLHYLLLFGIHF
jgi:hypothetical protein